MSVYLYHILIYQYFMRVINRVINCGFFLYGLIGIDNIYMGFFKNINRHK